MKPSDVFMFAIVYYSFKTIWALVMIVVEIVWMIISAVIDATIKTIVEWNDDTK